VGRLEEADKEPNTKKLLPYEGFTFRMLRHTTYRHLYEGEKRTQANRLQALVQNALDEEGTSAALETQNPRASEGFVNGRYWARTSDPQLVDRVSSLVICRDPQPYPLVKPRRAIDDSH
jgi:hypothetical protein